MKQQFLQTVTRCSDGRYSVSLPWVDERPIIPNNQEIAEKRLGSMTDKLNKQGKYDEYNKVFDEWKAEGLIEHVNENEINGAKQSTVNYLPHRAVFKPGSQTTPVRPVFDASRKSGSRSPSLNELLEKGPNLLELLPTILLRFRENRIGVASDIRKAFQMIEVAQQDRDFLRFLWWEDSERKLVQVYRHKSVVFGLNCSPFLLAAVLELHLKSVTRDRVELAQKLLQSLYVDNCATSVNSYREYEVLKMKATEILAEAKMDLRNWEYSLKSENEVEHENSEVSGNPVTKVLGLVWNKVSDTLSCEVPEF